MIVQLSKRPKAWINTLVLAGMTVFAVSAQAQQRHSAVEADAIMVSMGDDASNNGVAQVGFLDCVGGGSSCDGGGSCLGGCGSSNCCKPWWAHRSGGFGQFLLLRPGNVDHIYAVETDDAAAPNNFPTGPIGRVNVDEEAGFRLGMAYACSDCTSLVATFTDFDGNTMDSISAGNNRVLESLVHHPTRNTGDDNLDIAALYDIDFQLIDIAYRSVWKADNTCAINWFAGFRYGNMGQNLVVEELNAVANGLDTTTVNLDFHGFGMLLGADAERRSCSTGLLIYARGLSSFLAGDWKGDYSQVNQFGGGVVANDYEDYRITPVLELELGLGWQSECGKWRGTVGYMNSAWYDAISTRAYVDAFRDNNYTNVDETVTFSGLTAGLEGRF